ncbi:phage portal protein [Brevibacillus laterosporus]|uniref:phage portal protein n=1 Tax=Brevibacillus laterosporus TaxID=1465 RepID=UPI002E2389EA|nr:phage portal protein [Brevibacillus laterosporus]MED1790327.1 phage portal protein [Brevibacillus laterosporus]
MFLTETDRINKMIADGAKSGMTLEEFIQREVDEWEASEVRELMIKGDKYYRGDSEILTRKREVIGDGGKVEDKNLANNKLVHNFARKLADQKVGYLLSKPMSVQTNNNTYQTLLGDYIGKAFLRTLKNVGKESINKGKAWLQVYYNEAGELSFKRIPSEEVIPMWKDSAHTELDAVIRVYEIETYEGREKKTIKKVEYWDTQGVKRYVHDGQLIPDVEIGDEGSHFAVMDGAGQEKGLNWERVPFICFKYNDEEIPLIKFIQSLIDDYDYRKSDNANNLEDMPNSIYVLKDYDGTNLGEFRYNLAAYRAVKVTGEGGVDTISLPIDTDAFKTHVEMNRKDIYEFGRGVDTQASNFGNDPSGIALKFLYADLDMDANMIETEFQASMEHLRWFIDQHISNTGGGDFSNETVEFIFNRDILINETDAITNAKDSVGIISDETIVANHPWTTNAQDEIARKKKEREDMVSQSDPYAGFDPKEEPE